MTTREPLLEKRSRNGQANATGAPGDQCPTIAKGMSREHETSPLDHTFDGPLVVKGWMVVELSLIHI